MAARDIPAGAVLAAEDVALEVRQDDGAADHLNDPAVIVGQEAQRAIAAGAAIASADLKSRCWCGAGS